MHEPKYYVAGPKLEKGGDNRRMIKKLIRGVITVVGLFVGYCVYLLIIFLNSLTEWIDLTQFSRLQMDIAAAVFAIIFGILFFSMTPMFSRRGKKVATNIDNELQNISSHNIVMGTIGLIAGLVIAFFISRIYSDIENNYIVIALNLVTYPVLGYLGVVIASKSGQDFFLSLINTRKGTGQKAKSKNTDATPKVLDTSVIIDGRIADIMKTGFIEGNIVIPEFVLVELRHIADSSDGLKRNRGRRGLDILNRIQTEYGIEIYNTDKEKGLDEIPEVDVKLLKLAQIMNGKVVTNDFNLNKVATIKGVEVLNINELANTLKPVVLPGEEMTLFLVKEGKENNQAVAYLDDGTMIVVEEGRKFIGKTIDVVVTSVLQTSAGRMIFAKPK